VGGRSVPSRICLCLTEPSLAGAAALLDGHRGLFDLAELRADYLEPGELAGLGAFAAARAEQLVLTVRREREGGRWRGSEADRAAVLARALGGGGFRYVDLEHDFDPPGLRGGLTGARVIRSMHDFGGVPEGLGGILRTLGRDGEIPKLAVMPGGCADLARLLEEVCRQRAPERQRERIVLAMGEVGFPTRVLAARLGSYLTYCSAESGLAAPGQVTPGLLRELYRFPALSASSRVLGVIGNPIAHSASPRIHNAGLAALGLDAVYLPFLVDDVGQFLRVAGLLDVQGVSVTIPHKAAVIPHLARTDPSVDAIGACNTLVREGDGWYGTNTDGAGFLAPLGRIGFRLGTSTRATVIGAGGAARAVTHALREAGAEVLVLNRSVDRARRLVAELGGVAGPLGAEGARLLSGYADLVVQTTSCGMTPDEACDPIPEYRFNGAELVYELVYRPEVTPLVGRAREAGCRWIGGMEMLLEQAYEQFRLFTGADYPRP
jgi:3-dehydroquinate dehydratase / shikimate dehydrogenase